MRTRIEAGLTMCLFFWMAAAASALAEEEECPGDTSFTVVMPEHDSVSMKCAERGLKIAITLVAGTYHHTAMLSLIPGAQCVTADDPDQIHVIYQGVASRMFKNDLAFPPGLVAWPLSKTKLDCRTEEEQTFCGVWIRVPWKASSVTPPSNATPEDQKNVPSPAPPGSREKRRSDFLSRPWVLPSALTSYADIRVRIPKLLKCAMAVAIEQESVPEDVLKATK